MNRCTSCLVPERAPAWMLSIFLSERDCLWDHSQAGVELGHETTSWFTARSADDRPVTREMDRYSTSQVPDGSYEVPEQTLV